MEKILIYGGGNMGSVYAKTISEYYHDKDTVFIVEKHQENLDRLRSEGFACGNTIPDNFDTFTSIILAIKPQDFPSIVNTLAENIKFSQWVISIMAGVQTSMISKHLNHQKIVRTMPNLAIPHQQGMIGYYFPFKHLITEKERSNIIKILSLGGETIEVDHEDDINAITALSGSGPAYFFYIVQKMEQAARSFGFSSNESRLLALQTMKGALSVLENSPEGCESLIKMVSSRGGTTEAAFQIFNQREVGDNFIDGIKRANERADEMGQELTNFISNKLSGAGY
ncbi:pyrroline-5-carboxylate reductase family protein [Marinigracilibium pacificum]|uniref:Pyrroline-5-carboxylate reductase n=1 Tax=Marinigracilibium pacificum TaxID=2729599 RepID=A0A848J410_9BACT|nr:pyrroline-5-carboxylate reductase [Marinigracilibium pacificum]NMM50461.1 pyrroline-5-carboxylate reductase [Marinigracilibium pacificum]